MTNNKCEIITVGTELLLGQIVDTNSAWISEKLTKANLNVFHKQTVGDNYDRIFSVFEKAQQRSNVVFVTGGLGPTEDDVTRQVAADLFKCELVIHEETLHKVSEYFYKRNINMSSNNRKQALSFDGGLVFENKVGMAPALFYEHEQTLWFFLPGVPKEMKWLVEEQIFPFLKKKGLLTKQLFNRVLTFQGIGESTLEEELVDVIKNQSNPTIAPLAGNGYVTLRLTAQAKAKQEADALIDPVEALILNRVGDYFIGYGDVPLSLQVLNLLKEKNWTIASCESITGGLFASSIVEHDGASNVLKGSIVSYTNDVKESVVGVPSQILKTEGAVSKVTAKLMAENVRKKLNSHIGISFTGVAGKDPVEGFHQGTVFIGLSIDGLETEVKKVNLFGDRKAVRDEATLEGFRMILSKLK